MKAVQFFESRQQSHFVMEQIEGVTITDYFDKKNSPLTPKQASACCLQLAQSLNYMHSKGIVHRDLNPNNVMLTIKEDDF